MIKTVLYIILIGFRTVAAGLDYVFLVPEDGISACAGSENMYLDTYFDLSHIQVDFVDDETIILQGYVTFLKKVDASLHLHLQVQKYTSGRWVETAFHLDRADICPTMFDKNELWYEFVKDFEESSKQCPPNPGTKFEFKEKRVSTVIKDLSPGLEGTYRGVFKVFIAEKLYFCMNIEGDLIKKLPTSSNMMG